MGCFPLNEWIFGKFQECDLLARVTLSSISTLSLSQDLMQAVDPSDHTDRIPMPDGFVVQPHGDQVRQYFKTIN